MGAFHYILENGTKDDWERIKRENPNKWALLTDVKYDNEQSIIGFNLIALTTRAERDIFLDRYFNEPKRITTVRTTYADWTTGNTDDELGMCN